MEKIQIDIFNMGLSVQNHFNDNTTAWIGNAPLTAAQATLSTKLTNKQTSTPYNW